MPEAARRAGSAAATLDVRTVTGKVEITNVGVTIAPTPGRPTVPRAELWAAILATRTLPQGSSIPLGIDAAYVVKGMQVPGRRLSLQSGTNGDLWLMLFDAIEARGLHVQTIKVKAHAERSVLLGQIELRDYLGICSLTPALELPQRPPCISELREAPANGRVEPSQSPGGWPSLKPACGAMSRYLCRLLRLVHG